MKTSPYWAAVSILYEANEVCNTATAKIQAPCIPVSILYEANEVCNDGEDGHVEVPGQVSILYEANEVCNSPWAGCGAPSGPRFNPLRG